MIYVRSATADDLPALMEMLVEFHAENGLFALDMDRTVATVHDILRRGLIFLAFDGHDLVGTLAIAPAQVWYSSEIFLEECWMYVRPRARRSTALLKMLRRAMRVADDKGWPITFQIVTATDLDRKSRPFRRMEHVGRVFLRRAHHDMQVADERRA